MLYSSITRGLRPILTGKIIIATQEKFPNLNGSIFNLPYLIVLNRIWTRLVYPNCVRDSSFKCPKFTYFLQILAWVCWKVQVVRFLSNYYRLSAIYMFKRYSFCDFSVNLQSSKTLDALSYQEVFIFNWYLTRSRKLFKCLIFPRIFMLILLRVCIFARG